jgi:hemerythrin-like domain-containing protein
MLVYDGRVTSPLVQQLISDHQCFAALVDILERQADRLDAGERTDLEIVELILEYLQRYGDQCHHPREDAVYGRLREVQPELAQRASSLHDEHEDLRVANQLALVEVRRACDGHEIDAPKLAARLSRLVTEHRAHVRAENEAFFPLAIEVLDAGDWAAIEKEARVMAVAERALRIHERFVALLKYIHELDRLDPQ